LAQQFVDLSQHGDLIYKLGRYYHEGVGTTQNVTKAYELYRQSAGKGDPDAMFEIGKAMIEGTNGIEKNEEGGKKLVQESAKNGCEKALGFLQN